MAAHTSDQVPTLAQERYWFLDQFVRAPALNLCLRATLAGPLDPSVLDRVVADVIARHEALHIRIISREGRPALVDDGSPAPSGTLHIDDLSASSASSASSAAERAEQAAALCRQEASAAFDLAAGPLIRTRLIRLAEDSHVLLLAAHRAAADRTSLRLVLAEIAAGYAAAQSGQVAASPDASDFPQFAAAEVAAIQAPEFKALAEDWRDYLADVAPIELPTDRLRSVQPRYEAARVSRALDPGLLERSASTARTLGVSESVLLRSVFQALLHRYTGQDALAIGTTRPRESQWAGLVGPVDTTAVIRSAVGAETSLRDLAGGVDPRLPRLPRHPIPFEKLVEVINPPRDPSRSPVVQVVVSADVAAPPAAVGGAAVTGWFFEDSGATLYDLDVLIEAGGSEPRLTAVYRADLFDQSTISRMLEHYGNLLASALEAPEAPLATLPYLSDDELRRILEEFNDTDAPYPADATVQELFEAQVLRTPDARAVTFEGAHLTYRELNARANQLAHFLRAQGVGRGTLIGLCLERSFELIVAVLGVLKSGGAYVPFDPAYPADRLSFMLEDTDAPFALTVAKLLPVTPTQPGKTVFVLDEEPTRAAVAEQPTQNPENVNTADDLTYIVYTSGSTGRPKGVEQPHRGVARLVINTDILELDENTSYLQISPLSFDANTLEIYGPLLNGGRIVLLPPQLPTPAIVAKTVREQGADTIWLVAPLANLTIDTHLDDLAGLRQFMAGGDVLSIPHVRTVREKLPHVKMVNGYGPTEVTAFSVSHKITHIDPDWPSVPIGRPMANTTAYILDEPGNPVPIGVWGELYLGGPGVARGYHNRPELNETRFLPDHFRPAPGAQLYRTGDRCRWLPDGTIQFHGRLDTQVKIDGLRVELGEIQSVLAAHDSVGATVVTAPVLGTRRTLVAYVVPAVAASFDVDILRTHVAALLPSVMVPAHYVVLETIPLNPNNKVNFDALPKPDLSGAGDRKPPQTPTQRALADIWQELLGIAAVGADDNFFSLGGHSLRAVPMIVAISTRFGVDLAVQDVFEAPVLERLAERVEERMLAAVSVDELERLIADVAADG